ncbi:hypothetical protein K438DRAFT_1767375 [Mycena galopus ATCC 62051]|nr:hypothetical protein K438DRAFT_1767375 [Mycena galopus ATCC 62051]
MAWRSGSLACRFSGLASLPACPELGSTSIPLLRALADARSPAQILPRVQGHASPLGAHTYIHQHSTHDPPAVPAQEDEDRCAGATSPSTRGSAHDSAVYEAVLGEIAGEARAKGAPVSSSASVGVSKAADDEGEQAGRMMRTRRPLGRGKGRGKALMRSEKQKKKSAREQRSAFAKRGAQKEVDNAKLQNATAQCVLASVPVCTFLCFAAVAIVNYCNLCLRLVLASDLKFEICIGTRAQRVWWIDINYTNALPGFKYTWIIPATNTLSAWRIGGSSSTRPHQIYIVAPPLTCQSRLLPAPAIEYRPLVICSSNIFV